MQTQPTPPPTDPTAVMGRRIVAFLIDYAILLALIVGLFFAIADSATLANSSQASDVCELLREDEAFNFCLNSGSTVYATESGDTGLIILVGVAYWFFFRFLLTGVSGYSIGKAIMGLRVIKQADGQLAGMGPSFVRWLLGIVDFGFCWLVGLITGLATKGHRRVGDMVAGTLVVDKSQVGVAPVVPGLTAPEVAPAAWAPPPPSTPQPEGQWSAMPPASPPTAETPSYPPPEAAAPPSFPPLEAAAPPPFPPPATPADAAPPTFPPPATPPETAAPPSYPPPTTPPLTETAPEGEPTTAMPSVGSDAPTTATPPVAETGETTTPEMPTADEPGEMSEPNVPSADEPGEVSEANVPAADEPGDVSEANVPLADQPLPDRPSEPEPPTAEPEPEPAAQIRPGIDAPQWDEARNAYIQWDAELGQWMEWSDSQRRWIPIST